MEFEPSARWGRAVHATDNSKTATGLAALVPLPRITERSLYSALAGQLASLGFESIIESDVGGRFPDLVARHQTGLYVIQVRIDGEKTRRDLLRDALVAARKAETHNILTLVYSDEVRRLAADQDTVTSVALDSHVISDIYTEFLTSEVRDTARNVLLRLQTAIAQQLRRTDIGIAVEQLREEVESLAVTLRKLAGTEIEPALQSVVGRFDLFMALGEKSAEDARIAGVDLMAYLFLNQVLFYHIYAERSRRVDPLPASIVSVRQLSMAFRQIRAIDFKPIYSIELSELLPATHPGLVEIVNRILGKMRLIHPENVQLDLLGRFFHELLPPRTRDIVAAFYTHPIAAEILAGLSIQRGEDHAMDLACGSGTLLVAAYRRKQALAGFDTTARSHNKILRELTGIDIMPFAAHLTAVNLSVQSAIYKADQLRVSISDSLELIPGQKVKAFSRQLQTTLSGFSSQATGKGAVGLEDEAKPFILHPADVIIINPPFTDREKMPEDFRAKLNAEVGPPDTKRRIERLISVAGGASNLWAYFMVLADTFLRPGGTIAAVLPTNILRGKNTQRLRDFILDHYQIQCLVRACKDYGFTEGSELRDLLLVAKKEPPRPDSKTGIIWLKESIHELDDSAVREFCDEVAKAPDDRDTEKELFDLTWVGYPEMIAFRQNLTPLIAYSSLRAQKTFSSFITRLAENGRAVTSEFPSGTFFEGFHTSPKGRAKILGITNPITKERQEHALMTLVSSTRSETVAQLNSERLRFPSSSVLPAIRSLTSLSRMDVNGMNDHVIVSDYPEFPRIAQLASWRGKVDWDSVRREARGKLTSLAIPRKFNFYSPNFHLFGFYSDVPFVPFDFLKGVRTESQEQARMLCLYFNSIAFVAQAFAFREETQVRFPELREEDLKLIRGIQTNELSSSERSTLLETFEAVRLEHFPSLTDQLETHDPLRLKVDRTVLSVLGFSDESIETMLPGLYDNLVREFKATRGLRKRTFVEY